MTLLSTCRFGHPFPNRCRYRTRNFIDTGLRPIDMESVHLNQFDVKTIVSKFQETRAGEHTESMGVPKGVRSYIMGNNFAHMAVECQTGNG